MKKIFYVLFMTSTMLLIGIISLMLNHALKFESSGNELGTVTSSPIYKQEFKTKTMSQSVDVDTILRKITSSVVESIDDEFEIYGNTALTDKEFRSIVNQGNKVVYLMYRTNRKINLPYDASLYIKINNKNYSYEFCEDESLSDYNMILDIKSFVSKYINDRLTETMLSEKKSMRATVPTTFVNCVVEKEYMTKFNNKGYLTYHIAVSNYVANEKSIIYIVTVNSSFVPGIIAHRNGEKEYSKYRNSEGYVHMQVEQAYDSNEEYYYGRRWGNKPYKKDYWPLNEPSVIAVGSSIQTGVNLGYSFTNGFSLDNINVQQNKNIGANISFGYSKTITQQDPKLSAQLNSKNTDICEWSFKYHDPVEETYHLNTGYMFEMENSRNGMFIGDFRLKLDFWDKLYTGWAWFYEDYYASSDLLIRAGEEHAIYNFNNGMI